MHITCLTVGSRGDVQPFLNLSRALQKRGHQVRLATHARFASLVEPTSIEFFPLGADPLQMLQSSAGQAWLDSGQNPLALVSNMIRLGRPLIEQLIEETTAALEQTDGVVFSLFGNLAYHLAEAKNLPSIMVHLQPVMGRTTAFPVPGSPSWPSHIPLLGKLYNWLTFYVAEQVFWQPYRSQVQRWRQTLGLPKLPFDGPYRQLQANRLPFLYAYSDLVMSPPADWPNHYHVTGYWTQPEEEPSPALQRFVAQGEPPIYIGFGSMTDRHPQRLQEMVINTVGNLNQRAIILKGWAGLSADFSDHDHILALDQAPHEWLFPRMRAVVHHGGAGTTAAGLRSGKPNVVVPYFADQHFWGSRVRQLGAGPSPIPRKSLSEENLTAALHLALNDKEMQNKAAAVGQHLREENGVMRAVHLIESYFNKKRPRV